jgi:hypothetical protein
MAKKAAIWRINLFEANSTTSARCTECRTDVPRPNQATTSMIAHLAKHPAYKRQYENLKAKEAGESEANSKRQRTITRVWPK